MTTHNHAGTLNLVTPDEWREHIGRHIEARRLERGFSSRYQLEAASQGRDDLADISESWIRQMETGRVRRHDGTEVAPNPRGNKVLTLLEFLGWKKDALDALAAGADPDSVKVVDLELDALVQDVMSDYNSKIAQLPAEAQAIINQIIANEERKLQS